MRDTRRGQWVRRARGESTRQQRPEARQRWQGSTAARSHAHNHQRQSVLRRPAPPTTPSQKKTAGRPPPATAASLPPTLCRPRLHPLLKALGPATRGAPPPPSAGGATGGAGRRPRRRRAGTHRWVWPATPGWNTDGSHKPPVAEDAAAGGGGAVAMAGGRCRQTGGRGAAPAACVGRHRGGPRWHPRGGRRLLGGGAAGVLLRAAGRSGQGGGGWWPPRVAPPLRYKQRQGFPQGSTPVWAAGGGLADARRVPRRPSARELSLGRSACGAAPAGRPQRAVASNDKRSSGRVGVVAAYLQARGRAVPPAG